ncbi:hypothetical protein [Streptomyces sp. NPDC001389]|uniref:hypothetical protein n=1 Tax=Streptomyces sp. NPDC001389 TaxID=3364569 RepID=UPI0036A80374
MDSFYDEFLHPEATELGSIVTVTAESAAPEELPDTDFRAAKAAVAAAVDGLDEDVSFAVAAGSDYARMCHPDTMRTVRASPATKTEAHAAPARLQPGRRGPADG